MSELNHQGNVHKTDVERFLSNPEKCVAAEPILDGGCWQRSEPNDRVGAAAGREMDIKAIEAFLADAKKLRGDPPLWQPSPRPSEYEATWNIEDSIGIVAGQLRFKCPKAYRLGPSISVVVRGGLLVGRLDVDPAGEIRHMNPADAYKYGLPPVVLGSHIHTWEDNRDYVLRNERFGQLPYGRQLAPQIRKLPQAILVLAREINLSVGPDQRGLDVPPQAELFMDR